MVIDRTNPTAIPEIDAALAALLRGAQTVLGRRFVGMALYGSLATGGFDPRRSDIDTLVVTDGALPAALLPRLAEMHAALASGSVWGGKLEVTYLPWRALRRHDPDAPPRPYWNEGRLRLDHHGSDWVIQRHVLRERGVVVAGPEIAGEIDVVGPEELRRAVVEILKAWWAPMLDDAGRLVEPAYRAYVVSSLCRILHTHETGQIAPKNVATAWAREELGDPWAALVVRAEGWPDGPQRGSQDLSATQSFIRYALSRTSASLVGPTAGPRTKRPSEAPTPSDSGGW